MNIFLVKESNRPSGALLSQPLTCTLKNSVYIDAPQVPDPVKHISTSFDAALYGLKNDVLMMSSLTDRIFQTAFETLLTRNRELCDYVISDDEEIDILEKQVDQSGVILLI